MANATKAQRNQGIQGPKVAISEIEDDLLRASDAISAAIAVVDEGHIPIDALRDINYFIWRVRWVCELGAPSASDDRGENDDSEVES